MCVVDDSGRFFFFKQERAYERRISDWGSEVFSSDLLPRVGMRGLQRAEAHGVEFYSRDLSTRLSGWYVKHAEGAARYFEAMYGPLPRKVRMAQVWRERSMGYARTDRKSVV